MMQSAISLNVHFRTQMLVGLALGIWIYLFLVLVGPFDAADLSINIRIVLMLGYGLVFVLCYAIIIPIQNKLYRHYGRWKPGNEVAMVFLFCLICLPPTFAYYKTDLVNGTYDFRSFTLNVYLPILGILMPVIFAGRYLVAKFDKKSTNTSFQEVVTLLGDNKLDILKIALANLVAFEAANNYVIVHYLLEGKLQKKLLRTSLHKLYQTIPKMLQVHRSYVVNPSHFIAWENGSSLVLTQITIPVSNKYKPSLLAMSEFAPK